MNKKDLIDSLSNTLSTKKEAQDAVEKIFLAIRRSIREGDRVVLPNLGTFVSYIAKAKKGRNPNTGQAIQIAPKKKVRFRQAKDLFV